MVMPSILIDVPQEDLLELEKLAKANFRSRKAQIELIIDDWLNDYRHPLGPSKR